MSEPLGCQSCSAFQPGCPDLTSPVLPSKPRASLGPFGSCESLHSFLPGLTMPLAQHSSGGVSETLEQGGVHEWTQESFAGFW